MNSFTRLMCLFSAVSLLTFSASATRTVGNGGDGTISEFFSIFGDLIRPDYQVCYDSLPSPSMYGDLAKVRWNVIVKTEKNLSLDGVEKGAINYPQNTPPLLLLSEEKWAVSNLEQKTSLALHEVLHLAGYNDSNYGFSAKVLACIRAQSQKAEIQREVPRWILENCKTQVIPSLTRQELQLALSLDDPSAVWELSLVGQMARKMCLPGLKALQKESLLKFDEMTMNLLCKGTDDLSSLQELSSTPGQVLDFFDSLLKDFQKEFNPDVCFWQICQKEKWRSEIDQHPEIKSICTRQGD